MPKFTVSSRFMFHYTIDQFFEFDGFKISIFELNFVEDKFIYFESIIKYLILNMNTWHINNKNK